MASNRRTLAAAVATIAASLSLYPIFYVSLWFFAGAAAIWLSGAKAAEPLCSGIRAGGISDIDTTLLVHRVLNQKAIRRGHSLPRSSRDLDDIAIPDADSRRRPSPALER